jgi:conjugal transfer pilus assembly protein TraI
MENPTPPSAPAHRGADLLPAPSGVGHASAVVSYPPIDQGIQIASIDEIMAAQKDLIDRIFRTSGLTKPDFDTHIRHTILNLARFVHLLPATQTAHHRGTGGLFRFALEVGMFSMQAANAAVFPIPGSIDKRFLIQPKWALATFLAGLCGQLYRTINAMSVATRTGVQWMPLMAPLYDWAIAQGESVYFVRWRENKSNPGQAASAFVMNQIVASATLQHLSLDNNLIMPAMTNAIVGGDHRGENPIGKLVAPIITRVIDKDLRLSAINYGHMTVGVHLEPHLIDAMRRQVRSGTWSLNQPGGVLWAGKEGVFLNWPVAAAAITNTLKRDGFMGVPQDPETLAEILVEAKILMRPHAGHQRYWTISEPATAVIIDSALRIVPPDLIFPLGYDLEPYARTALLIGDAPKEAKAAAAPVSDGQTQLPLGVDEVPVPAKQRKRTSAGAEPRVVEAPAAASREEPARVADKPIEDLLSEATRVPQTPEPSEAASAPKPAAHGDAQPGGQLLDGLKRESKLLLEAILASYRRRENLKNIIILAQGLGIADSELSAHGVNGFDLVSELNDKGWLWKDPTRPTRKVIQMAVGERQLRLMILKGAIARAIGFDWSGEE